MRIFNGIQPTSLLIICFPFSAAFVVAALCLSSDNATNLDKFHMDIKQNELYPANSPFVDSLLNDMATQPILHVGKFVAAVVASLCLLLLFLRRHRCLPSAPTSQPPLIHTAPKITRLNVKFACKLKFRKLVRPRRARSKVNINFRLHSLVRCATRIRAKSGAKAHEEEFFFGEAGVCCK